MKSHVMELSDRVIVAIFIQRKGPCYELRIRDIVFKTSFKTRVRRRKKKVCERRDSTRGLATCPDLLRLTRPAVWVAELLPWPDG